MELIFNKFWDHLHSDTNETYLSTTYKRVLKHFSITTSNMYNNKSHSVTNPGNSQVTQWFKIRLPMQETQVRALGHEDPLEKEMATRSSILS